MSGSRRGPAKTGGGAEKRPGRVGYLLNKIRKNERADAGWDKKFPAAGKLRPFPEGAAVGGEAAGPGGCGWMDGALHPAGFAFGKRGAEETAPLRSVSDAYMAAQRTGSCGVRWRDRPPKGQRPVRDGAGAEKAGPERLTYFAQSEGADAVKNGEKAGSGAGLAAFFKILPAKIFLSIFCQIEQRRGDILVQYARNEEMYLTREQFLAYD